MNKIALAVITRDTKEDALLLKRLLDNVKPHVDGLFITAAYTEFPGHIKKVCEEYGAHYSEFKWVKDFAAARNFNFSQVTEDYDYILWSDIDDTWTGLDKIKDHLGTDAVAFWYIYDIDEDNQPTIVHKKTMLVKNDGTFIWKGKIHEDLDNERQISMEFVEDIKRVHATNDERIEEATHRNAEIAKVDYENMPEDPRTHYNYGNSLLALGKIKEAIDVFDEFLKNTGSQEEKYLILQRMGWAYHQKGDKEQAIKCFLMAIGLEPNVPDAFLELGKLFYELKDNEQAERYTLFGLPKKPTYRAMVVFNPRDYDYNPINLLAKLNFAKGRPDLAYKCIQQCIAINPNPKMIELEKEMKVEVEEMDAVTKEIQKLSKIEDKEELKKAIDNLPTKYRSHPGISMIRNRNFFKEESSGKDLTYYCGHTSHEWNPKLFREKGFGGSEEAVIHLSKALAKKGMNVTVYANIGAQVIEEDGVTWRPYWEFNPRDKIDYLILWRSPRVCDYELNTDKIFIDLHDTVPDAEFTKKRLSKISKIFVKTNAHRALYENIPDEKFIVVPNGVKTEDFEGPLEKDDMLVINTSSPDRSLRALAKIMHLVKKQIPEAKCQWAYGWDGYDAQRKDKVSKELKEEVETYRDLAGIESLGKVPQHEIADLYKKANVFLYPTEFYEIDCISVKKAQLAGCQVISTDFAALNESVQYGIKIHSEKNTKNWVKPYQIDFSADDSLIPAFVDETVKALKAKKVERQAMRDWAQKFNWDTISSQWYTEIYGN